MKITKKDKAHLELVIRVRIPYRKDTADFLCEALEDGDLTGVFESMPPEDCDVIELYKLSDTDAVCLHGSPKDGKQ